MRSPCGPYPRCLHPVFSLKMASSKNTRSSAAYFFISSIYASLSASLRERERRAMFFRVHLLRLRSRHTVDLETTTPRSTASQKAISSCIIQPSIARVSNSASLSARVNLRGRPKARFRGGRAVSKQVTLSTAYRTHRYKDLFANRLWSPPELEKPYTLGHFGGGVSLR